MEAITGQLSPETPTSSRGSTGKIWTAIYSLCFLFAMSADVDAREITIAYTGGSVTMTVGNAKDLFGQDNPLVSVIGEEKTVSVQGHSRTRVIGGASKTISGYSYTYTQWPTGGHGQSAGGEEVMMSWTGSDGEWLARVSGSLWEFGKFLSTSSPKTVFFQAKGGKPYGPFKAD